MTSEEANITTENLINTEEDGGTTTDMIESLEDIEQEISAKRSDIKTGAEIYQFSSYKKASHRAKELIIGMVDPMIRNKDNVVFGQSNVIPLPDLILPLPLPDALSPNIGNMDTQYNTGQNDFVPVNDISQYTSENDGSSIGNAKTYRTSASHSSADANSGNRAA